MEFDISYDPDTGEYIVFVDMGECVMHLTKDTLLAMLEELNSAEDSS